jgi:hypothetical protein
MGEKHAGLRTQLLLLDATQALSTCSLAAGASAALSLTKKKAQAANNRMHSTHLLESRLAGANHSQRKHRHAVRGVEDERGKAVEREGCHSERNDLVGIVEVLCETVLPVTLKTNNRHTEKTPAA